LLLFRIEHFFFLVTAAKSIGNVTIGEARRRGIRALLILSYSLCCTTTIDTAISTLLKDEAQQIFKNLQIFSIGAANAPRFAFGCGGYTPLCLLVPGALQRQ
jgi:hypothetical protein